MSVFLGVVKILLGFYQVQKLYGCSTFQNVSVLKLNSSLLCENLRLHFQSSLSGAMITCTTNSVGRNNSNVKAYIGPRSLNKQIVLAGLGLTNLLHFKLPCQSQVTSCFWTAFTVPWPGSLETFFGYATILKVMQLIGTLFLRFKI